MRLNSENKCKIYVEKIRSYQTLIYKNGHRTFPKQAYKDYKQELHKGMSELKPIKEDVPFKLILRLNVKEAYTPSKHRIKLKSTGNTSKVFESKEEALEYLDEEKHYYEYVPLEIRYGSVADVDNAMKPIIDYLEEMQIISNDRYAMSVLIEKTFGNEEESIEIELIEMKPIEEEVISFQESIVK